MIVYKEISLADFEAWSGGEDTLYELTDEEIDTLERELQMIYPDGMEETELNDYLRFEDNDIANLLGYDSWKDLREHHGLTRLQDDQHI